MPIYQLHGVELERQDLVAAVLVTMPSDYECNTLDSLCIVQYTQYLAMLESDMLPLEVLDHATPLVQRLRLLDTPGVWHFVLLTATATVNPTDKSWETPAALGARVLHPTARYLFPIQASHPRKPRVRPVTPLPVRHLHLHPRSLLPSRLWLR